MVIGVSAAAGAAPRWQPVPNSAVDHRAVAVAAGRFWIVDGPPGGGPVIARSARITSRGLTSWTAVRLGAAAEWGFTTTPDDDLIVTTGNDPVSGLSTLKALKLRPDGKVGGPTEAKGAPPPASSNGSRIVRLRDRVLQLVDANPRTPRIETGACCDTDGNVADYSSFVHTSPADFPPNLGVDKRGRLWLAWDYRTGKQQFTAWAIGLDPKTLRPRGQAQKVPSLRFATIVDVVCAEVCRLVMSGSSRSRSTKARAFSWAPGEGASTALLTPHDFRVSLPRTTTSVV